MPLQAPRVKTRPAYTEWNRGPLRQRLFSGRLMTSSERLVGRCIGGDFDIQRLIAAGGVGSVYEAVQRSTGKSRAIKLMHAWLASDEKMRSRFVDEARIAGSIESDHVVEVVSSGIDHELGVPWFAMELLRGQTLADYAASGGPMTNDECLEVLTQARHGLQMAHARSLVHRDLKPDNLFVAAPRRLGVPFTIKVLDFGIAKWVQDVREGDKNSQAIGTPSWMAPEQLSYAAVITPSTDVWAIGLLAFWMLTGREYWLAANDGRSGVSAVLVELLAGSRSSASARARELGVGIALPEAFDEWLAQCIDVEPSRRFADAASCIDALELVLGPHKARESVHLSPARGVSGTYPARTREIDAPFAHHSPDDLRAVLARAHAETAELETRSERVRGAPSAAPAAARPTARRLAPGEREDVLWGGSAAARNFMPLAELIASALPAANLTDADRETAPSGRLRETDPFPDRLREAVRHVCLILGLNPPALIAIEAHREAFTVESISPTVLGVSSALVAERSPELLRAHAAVGVARSLMAFAVHGLLGSADELESARKATMALARGTVSGSPLYRPFVSRLGPRRSELFEACRLAEPVAAHDYWRGVELTIARLAYLCSADRDAARRAIAAVPFAASVETIDAELDRFERSPGFDGYWYSSRRA
jgi:tRNA A-37 threonylcarbamoyl transferase component Bud32